MNEIIKKNLGLGFGLSLSHSSKMLASKFTTTTKTKDDDKKKKNTSAVSTASKFTSDSKSGARNMSQTSSSSYMQKAYEEAGKARGIASGNAGKLKVDHTTGGSSSNWDADNKKSNTNTQKISKSGSSGNWNEDNTMHYSSPTISPSSGNEGYQTVTSAKSPPSSFNEKKIDLNKASKPTSNNKTDHQVGGSSGRWDESNKGESSESYTAPESWGTQGSQEFKDNKKKYNQWYYEQNKDKWKEYNNPSAFNRSGQVDALNQRRQAEAAKNATANMYRDRAYEEAGRAMGKAMGNLGKTRTDTVATSSSTSTGNQVLANMSSSGTTSRSIGDILSSAFKSLMDFGRSLLKIFF